MAQNDVIRSTDMEALSTASVTRFNDWKRAYSYSENARYTITTSTFGGSTQTLPNASSTLGGQSEFLRNKFLDFSSGSTGAWTLQTPLEDRTFIIRNGSGGDITLDTTATTTNLVVPDTKTYTVNLYESGPSFVLVKDHIDATAFSSTKPYAVAVYRPGNMSAASEVFTKIVMARDFLVPADFTDSQGHLDTAPDAVGGSLIIDILFNSTVVGTCTFATGSTVGTFSTGTSFTFNPTDILEIRNDSTGSSAASVVAITIYGSAV